MSLKHGLLGLLTYTDMTGYELNKAFSDSLDFFWQAQMSQIYRELNGMETNGWLTSYIINQTSKPNKKKYSITENGRKEFLKWLKKFDVKEETEVKRVFLMKVFFSGERPIKDTIKMLEEFKKFSEKSLLEFDKAKKSTEQYGEMIGDKDKAFFWKLTIMQGEYCYDAEIRWATEAIRLLREKEKDKK